ncbi:MAG: 4Fe-4S dicluster domain-containing protein [Deltaproteobacteria bacterium]|nr:4Fe-4S dicluster domain-containing protein [Deltaproteobacteria bacterium]
MRIISVDELHPDFAEEIIAQPGGEGIRRCFACGTCTMSCPVREVNEAFNPRRLIRMCLLGMKQEVLQSDFVWLCSNCYACQERCPQGIHIAELMRVLKNMAYRYGNVPQGVRTQKERILQMGRIYEISEFDNKKRQKLDLPELPTCIENVGVLLAED